MEVKSFKEMFKIAVKRKKNIVTMHNFIYFTGNEIVATDGKQILIKKMDTKGISGLIAIESLLKAKEIKAIDKDKVLIDGVEVFYATDILYPQLYKSVLPTLTNEYMKFEINKRNCDYFIDWNKKELIPFYAKSLLEGCYLSFVDLNNNKIDLKNYSETTYIEGKNIPKYVKYLMIKTGEMSKTMFENDDVVFVSMKHKII